MTAVLIYGLKFKLGGGSVFKSKTARSRDTEVYVCFELFMVGVLVWLFLSSALNKIQTQTKGEIILNFFFRHKINFHIHNRHLCVWLIVTIECEYLYKNGMYQTV